MYKNASIRSLESIAFRRQQPGVVVPLGEKLEPEDFFEILTTFRGSDTTRIVTDVSNGVINASATLNSFQAEVEEVMETKSGVKIGINKVQNLLKKIIAAVSPLPKEPNDSSDIDSQAFNVLSSDLTAISNELFNQLSEKLQSGFTEGKGEIHIKESKLTNKVSLIKSP